MRLSRVTLLAMVVLCLVTVVAWGKPKVAIPAFQNDSNSKVRDGVAEAIDGDDFEVLSKRETNKVADKLELADISDKQAKTLAFDLGADVLVLGELSKKGGKTVLKVKLYVDGKKAKGFSIQFKNPKSKDFQKAFLATLQKKVDAAGGGGDEEEEEEEETGKGKGKGKGGDEEEEEEEEQSAKGKGKGGDDEEEEEEEEQSSKKKKKKKKKGGDDEEEEEEEEEEVDSPLEDKSLAQPNRAAVRVDIGASAANRSLRFTSRSFPEAPRPYSNAVVPGARVELELYPLAFSDRKSPAAGLGIAAEFDRTLVLNLGTTTEPGIKVPTKQQHWSVGARFRIMFGKKPTSGSLTLGLDYAARTFVPDRTPLTDPRSLDLPDTDYRYVAPMLALRLPIVKQVAIIAGGDGKAVMNAGPIQTAASYGKAKIIGFEAYGGLDIVVNKRIAIRLTGEFVQFGYTFVGTGGMLTNNRDMDPTTKDIGGAEDRSVGGAVTLGVMY
jgi:hypothetical protein